MSRFAKIAALSAAMLVATAAQAHPKLMSSTPAANATVEKLVAPFSGVELVMTGMPGMPGHGPMKMSGIKTAVGTDGKTLIATPKSPLPAGDYKLNWHAVAGDSHRIDGSFTFHVK